MRAWAEIWEFYKMKLEKLEWTMQELFLISKLGAIRKLCGLNKIKSMDVVIERMARLKWNLLKLYVYAKSIFQWWPTDDRTCWYLKIDKNELDSSRIR